MTLALLTFAFLYAVIWLFERERVGMDWFRIAVAAVVPIIVMLLTTAAAAFAFGASFATMGLSVAALTVSTFLVLWKIVGVAPKHAAIYAFAVLVFHALIGAGIMAIGTPDQTLYGDFEWPDSDSM
jgi:hypothetical protein